jgi:cold shock CspA family protein
MQVIDVNTLEQNEVVEEEHECVVVEEEVNTPAVGAYVGQCKWFNDLLGYGFVTVCDGDDKGKDIFVHHSGIMPLNSNYRTLRKGEYLNFNIINGMNGLQAVDVTGINGGPLMCDFVSVARVQGQVVTGKQHQTHQVHQQHPRATVQTQGQTSPHTNVQRHNGNGQHTNGTIGSQWYVVTKSGRKKNLAKYSKEGRVLMKQAKQGEAV